MPLLSNVIFVLYELFQQNISDEASSNLESSHIYALRALSTTLLIIILITNNNHITNDNDFNHSILYIAQNKKILSLRLTDIFFVSLQLQIYGYNSDLFSNFSEALALCKSDSIVAIAILIQVRIKVFCVLFS